MAYVNSSPAKLVAQVPKPPVVAAPTREDEARRDRSHDSRRRRSRLSRADAQDLQRVAGNRRRHADSARWCGASANAASSCCTTTARDSRRSSGWASSGRVRSKWIRDSRFRAYMGHKGWMALDASQGRRMSASCASLLVESYRHFASRRALAELDVANARCLKPTHCCLDGMSLNGVSLQDARLARSWLRAVNREGNACRRVPARIQQFSKEGSQHEITAIVSLTTVAVAAALVSLTLTASCAVSEAQTAAPNAESHRFTPSTLRVDPESSDSQATRRPCGTLTVPGEGSLERYFREAPAAFDNRTNGFDPQGPAFDDINEDTVVPLRSFNDNRFIFEEVETVADGLGPDVQCAGLPRMSPEHRHGWRQPDRRAPHRAPGTAAVRRVGGWFADPVAFDPPGHLRACALRRQRQHVPHFHQHCWAPASSRPSPTTRCWPFATRSPRRFVARRWKWRCSRPTTRRVSADSAGRASTPAWSRLRRMPI